MAKDFDIDSILAEIRTSKAGEQPSRRPAPRQPEVLDDYDERPVRRAVQPPRQPEVVDDYDERPVRRSVQPPRQPEVVDDYDEPRPVRRAAPRQPEVVDDYDEPRPVRRAAPRQPEVVDDYDEPRPVRRAVQPPRQPEVVDDYDEPRPVRRPAPRQPEVVDDYDEPRPVRRAAPRQPEVVDDYDERPVRRAAPRQPEVVDDYDERPVRRAAPRQPEVVEDYDVRPVRRAAPRQPEVVEDYDVRPVRRPAPRQPEVVADDYAEPRPARRLEDEWMKNSGLSSANSGVKKNNRDNIRNNFGSVAEPQPKGRKAKLAQEEAAAAKPDAKGGFRFQPTTELTPQEEPEEYDTGLTRLDLPLEPPAARAQEESFSHTRHINLDEADVDSVAGAGRQAYPEDEEEDEPISKMEMDEFTTPAEAAGVKEDIATMRGSFLLQFGITMVCSLALLYLGLSTTLALPLPDFLSLTDAPVVFMITNLVLLCISALVCHNTIAKGVTGLFTLKANHDSLPATAVLASVIQGVALMLGPEALAQEGIHIYFAVTCLGLLLNTVGKMFALGRVAGNFRLLVSPTPKYTVEMLKERDLSRDFTWDMNIDDPHIAYSVKTEFVSSFVEQSYVEDSSDNVAKIGAPIIFLGAVLVAVMSYLFNKDLFIALSTFAALLAIASPLTSTLVGSLPLHRAYRTLSQSGAMLSGYAAVERFQDTNVVLADACELFASEEVLLHHIKTFEKNRIDEAILDAASVLCVCNGAVKNIFLKIIQGNTKILRPVETLVYEDGMGISAWVNGKRVLIGNSELMKHHGIATPSRDYEAKYRTEERDLLYLANSGELTAMFVISYVRNAHADFALGELERRGISVVVKSVDPNLTAAKIARIYDLPEEMIRILPAKLHREFDRLGQSRDSAEGGIVHDGQFDGLAHAVSAASSVKVTTDLGVIVQTVGMVLGYTLITVFSFLGNMSYTGLVMVLTLQAIWTLAVWLFPMLRRI